MRDEVGVAAALRAQAHVLVQQGRAGDAVSKWEAAGSASAGEAQAPDVSAQREALHGLGLAMVALGRAGEAEAWLLSVLEHTHDALQRARACLDLGSLYLELGRVQDAQSYLSRGDTHVTRVLCCCDACWWYAGGFALCMCTDAHTHTHTHTHTHACVGAEDLRAQGHVDLAADASNQLGRALRLRGAALAEWLPLHAEARRHVCALMAAAARSPADSHLVLASATGYARRAAASIYACV